MIKFAISPCPNDIFNFYKLLIDKNSLSFDYHFDLKPLHELNQAAAQKNYDFIKTSFTTYFEQEEQYNLCSMGLSMTYKNGPVVFARKNYSIDDLRQTTIATPGSGTVGHFLVKALFDPQMITMPFYEIIDAIKAKKVDAGVIIHEARTEYERHGLYKICDLAKLWYEKYKTPTPLGSFLAKKDLSSDIYDEVMVALKKSREFARENQEEVIEYALKSSQERDRKSLRQHIENFALSNDLIDDGVHEAIVQFRNLCLNRSN